ncbi:MAG: DNA mismatch repair protein MutS [Thermomicrobiales bacterium]|nr:MAG: DNA mismatch repair protein MutS [Thermomicrobiales bacterium]
MPSRRQYLELKAQHPGAILLYRLGDFYETFDEDAKIVARDARITLTSRSFGRNGRVPMAGIPHHALNYYLGRLLAAGHTVAIAEQLSEPGRGLVHRAVTRVLTPGTVAEPGLLPATENRYLAAIAPRGDRIGLAWVDVSTGEFATTELAGGAAVVRLQEELARLNPAECIIPDRMDHPGQPPTSPDDLHLTGSPMTTIQETPIASPPASSHVTRLESWHFDPQRAAAALCERFGVRSLAPFGCAEQPAAIGAAGAILAYVERTNPRLLPLLVSLRTERADRHVGLDAATRRNLELTRSHRTGGTRGSLLGVLDLTRTPQGARYLRRLIGQPLRDLTELKRRQAIIAALVAAPHLRPHLGDLLVQVGDVERLTGRITQGQASAREFLTLASALRIIPAVTSCLEEARSEALTALATAIDPCADLLHVLDAAVEEDDGGVARIRPGFSERLDAAIEAIQATRAWLASLERHERERTGIRSLKVGYNKVFGYYIEVTRPNLHLVPPEYVRKQTVATGERYVTAALKEAEARLLAAGEEIAAIERDVLDCLSERVAATAARLLRTAERLAELDAFLSLAEVAARNNWTQPVLEESEDLVITGGRHPVVEASLGGEPFIPNDCHLGGDAPRVLLVTGPNMGGKSTYLRQVAIIVLLAQIGSFVPAASARIGLVDRIFTRVGAHDDLAGGASTFMVEMIETATILHQATRRSLLILDEIGRGTSTNDGLAIARAVLEDIHHRIGARTLFATHFLELAALAEELPYLANVHVAAMETEGRIIFLYAVRPGCADRAYGIHVARLAGLPPWVADRAEEVLNDLPRTGQEQSMEPAASSLHANGVCCEVVASEPSQLTLQGFPPPLSASRLARELKLLDLTSMTPKQALDWLFEQQARL